MAALVTLFAWSCSSTPAERRDRLYELREDPSARNVERIRAHLADEDRDVRATALYGLVAIDVPDAPELALAALEDPDGFVRATAAKLLGDLGVDEAVPALVEHLRDDPDPVTRQRCAETLGLLGGEPAAAALCRALDDPLKQVRLAAVDGAARLDPGGCYDRLALLLFEDPEWEIRARAANGLGLSGDAAAVEPLRRALDDRNEFVRSAAANALTMLDGRRG